MELIKMGTGKEKRLYGGEWANQWEPGQVTYYGTGRVRMAIPKYEGNTIVYYRFLDKIQNPAYPLILAAGELTPVYSKFNLYVTEPYSNWSLASREKYRRYLERFRKEGFYKPDGNAKIYLETEDQVKARMEKFIVEYAKYLMTRNFTGEAC